MSVTEAIVAVPAVVEKKSKKAAGPKKPAAKPTHPSTQQMVDAAIKALNERGGSSLLAVKKYIAANYQVDIEKINLFIKKYLKSSVVSGKFIQTKGKGASGSFKLSVSAKKNDEAPKPKKKKATVKKTGEKKSTKTTKVEKKQASPEKKKKTSAAAAKKTVEKKKSEQIKAKVAKKTGVVKAKPAAKPKAAAIKSKPAAAAKKPTAVSAKKPKTPTKKPVAASPKKPKAVKK